MVQIYLLDFNSLSEYQLVKTNIDTPLVLNK